MAKAEKAELVFVPLGGVGEIGMNFALYGFGPANKREWIIIDVGVTFPDATLPGVDLVLPDTRFIEEQLENLRGIIITHAHEDHYGALHDTWPKLKAPVWMTPFAAGLLEAKRQSEQGAPKIPVTVYRAGEKFTVGPFEIEAIAVSHSIPEPVSLAITSPAGTVIHTGDWKIDPAPEIGPMTDEARFRAYGDKGVLALVCDSTNALREGDSPSEQQVGQGLRKVIEEAKGRVAVTTFSSNVGRIRSIAEAARDAGRQVLVMGRSLKRVIDVSSELGYMDGLPEFVSEEDYGYIPRENLVVICTGSQGEPRAALAKLARDEMKSVALSPGDTVVFSSRTIPGNEKAILEIKNLLIDQGIKIIEDGDALVHVSGHPRRSELKRMYEWVRPRIGVPVHGEAAHLVGQGSLMSLSGIPEVAQIRDGDMLRLWPGAAEIIDQVPFGRVYKDGKLIGSDEAMGIRDRRKLSFAGHVAVNVVLDDKYELAGDPDLVAIGVAETDAAGEDLEELMLDAAIGAVDSIPRARRKDLDLVQEAVRRAVRGAANEAWGKKPLVTVFVTR
ncbi:MULTISPECIES: ribonuclease J [Aminobacter]|jgi:ribonuclease J|uniref:Beta-lactamase n=2 Tax=Aminobacter TaxID=31988 RepID=A0AAC9ARH8_AMIAI|nr:MULTISPECIES: ribonuclease J [Aminobacter]AMS41867.1 beta-lactamase [Aminobacter aminovorans]MBA8904748.1 ribonuclease J [Aminobacter ciceronei]MBA9018698.1 ribonuclease J [Aminobacter ciceronei]MBB3703784.1 ribonuclease J [Aminobacter aminovorans]MRX31460.1 MBL fold metallo-hydrolase [Aminobacter sp. MDW-2]